MYKLKWHYICIKSLLSIILLSINEYVQIDDIVIIIYNKSLKAKLMFL